MGKQARDYVWAKSKQTGGALLVMLAIAEHIPDGSDEGYPGIPRIAQYARISERQVQRILEKLESGDKPELIITRGQGRGHNSTYRIIGLRKGDISDTKGDTDVAFYPQEKVTSEQIKGDISDIKGDICDTEKVTSGVRKGDIFSTPPTPPYKAEPIEPINEPKEQDFANAQSFVGQLPDDGSAVGESVLQDVEKRKRELCKAIVNLKDKKRIAEPNENEWRLILDIFREWRREMSKPAKTKLTPERGRAVLERIRSPVCFKREDFSLAFKGCKSSAHHQGLNDRATVYDDLELICRSDQNLERFIGYNETKGTVNARSQSNRNETNSVGPRTQTVINRDYSIFRGYKPLGGNRK